MDAERGCTRARRGYFDAEGVAVLHLRREQHLGQGLRHRLRLPLDADAAVHPLHGRTGRDGTPVGPVGPASHRKTTEDSEKFRFRFWPKIIENWKNVEYSLDRIPKMLFCVHFS